MRKDRSAELAQQTGIITAMLPDNVIKLFEENLWFIATGNGEPNVVPVGFKCVCDDGKLAIGAILLDTTLENIRLNNRIAIAAANPLTAQAYQIKGTAEIVREGSAFEHYRLLTEETFKGTMKLKCVILVTPELLICASPDKHNKEIIPL